MHRVRRRCIARARRNELDDRVILLERARRIFEFLFEKHAEIETKARFVFRKRSLLRAPPQEIREMVAADQS